MSEDSTTRPGALSAPAAVPEADSARQSATARPPEATAPALPEPPRFPETTRIGRVQKQKRFQSQEVAEVYQEVCEWVRAAGVPEEALTALAPSLWILSIKWVRLYKTSNEVAIKHKDKLTSRKGAVLRIAELEQKLIAGVETSLRDLSMTASTMAKNSLALKRTQSLVDRLRAASARQVKS